MENDNAVIRPRNPKNWPSCPHRTAVMVSSPADMKEIVKKAGLSNSKPHLFMNSQMYCNPVKPSMVCVAGPFIGAPYAVMLLETLVAWGIERVVFFGWCGSICAGIGIGEIIVPTAAFSGDGTSLHYCPTPEVQQRVPASSALHSMIMDRCREMSLSCKEGPIWTTDAVFRETPWLIEYYQKKGAIAVEMETAALFSVGAYRGLEVAAVLAVSDELHTFSWQTGFGSNSFRNARKNAIELILSMTRNLQQECPS